MRRRFPALLLALGLVVAACGSDREGIDSYFGSLHDVTDAYVIRVGELPVASTSSSLEDIRAYFDGVGAALEDAIADLEAITPPVAAADAHPDFLTAMGQFSALADRVAVRASALETPDDLAAMARDPEVGVGIYNAVEEQVVRACLDLQAVADGGEVDVDLRCAALASD